MTNHSYLDNPTFRAMRRSLMETFDRIYLLDLHGNTRRREAAPDGSKDMNVLISNRVLPLASLSSMAKTPTT